MNSEFLYVEDVTKNFGEINAIDDLSLSFPEGEVTAVIGPNGAGKTTLINLLTGKHKPTSGKICFQGERLDLLNPHEIAQLGIARSYQIVNFFPDITVYENIRLAAQTQSFEYSYVGMFRNHTELSEPHAITEDILDRLDLWDVADKTAAELSHGFQRYLEIAVALATQPEVILLDEPTSGMGAEDIEKAKNIIRDLAASYTIILIEHNMEVVMEIADNVAVLMQGSLLAFDSPKQVRQNDDVQKAYLGGTV